MIFDDGRTMSEVFNTLGQGMHADTSGPCRRAAAHRVPSRRDGTCSERVVFPAFGKSAMLPPYQDVVVALLLHEPGKYEFTCQTGVLHGTLVVEGDGGDA